MDDINKFKRKLVVMESQNEILGRNLDIMDQERKQILGYLSEDLTNEDWNRGLENFEKHVNNSDRMVQMMKDQNKITQDTLSTTRGILKLLENTHANTEFLRYRDWVAELIEEIIIRLGKIENVNGWDAWANISRAFSIKLKSKKVDFAQDAIPYLQLLSKVLDKTGITLEEFEFLMKMKWKSNSNFHLEESQTIEEVLEELEQFLKSPPDGLQDYVVPLMKAIYVVKTWRYD
ncbi:231_t:CDS:1 [Funneliformis caledonium]|uniref:231_t:CDS:1 n=1 Tax=Funneliformis caledonium TaxID=1117310 RepID=A0A9N9GYP3_9GLOM|nr:231_t:CDS:1 [Funneliformis caledonium]